MAFLAPKRKFTSATSVNAAENRKRTTAGPSVADTPSPLSITESAVFTTQSARAMSLVHLDLMTRTKAAADLPRERQPRAGSLSDQGRASGGDPRLSHAAA